MLSPLPAVQSGLELRRVGCPRPSSNDAGTFLSWVAGIFISSSCPLNLTPGHTHCGKQNRAGLVAVVDNWGQFRLQGRLGYAWGHSWLSFWEGWCYWNLLLGRGNGCCPTSHRAQNHLPQQRATSGVPSPSSDGELPKMQGSSMKDGLEFDFWNLLLYDQ